MNKSSYSTGSIMKDVNRLDSFKKIPFGSERDSKLPQCLRDLETLLNKIRNKQVLFSRIIFGVSILASVITFFFSYEIGSFVLIFSLLLAWFITSVFNYVTAFLFSFNRNDKLFIERDEVLKELTNIDYKRVIKATAEVTYSRVSGGAKNSLDLASVGFGKTQLPGFLKSFNTLFYSKDSFYRLNVLGKEIYFLPDFILICAKKINIIMYSSLKIEVDSSVFLSSDEYSDSVVIGKTWKYVCNDGTPDLRFNDNYQVFKYRFAELTFSTSDGMKFTLLLSSYDKASLFLKHLNDVQNRN